MRKLYKIRIEADDETIFYAHIQRESYGKDIAIKEELIRGRS